MATGAGALCCYLVSDALMALLATVPKVRLLSWPRRKQEGHQAVAGGD